MKVSFLGAFLVLSISASAEPDLARLANAFGPHDGLSACAGKLVPTPNGIECEDRGPIVVTAQRLREYFFEIVAGDLGQFHVEDKKNKAVIRLEELHATYTQCLTTEAAAPPQ